MSKRQWYRIENAAGDAADIHVYDFIGRAYWDDDPVVSAKAFIKDLKALPESIKTLRVHVNSPGGDPWEATAIANSLLAQRNEKGRTVEVLIEGLAASAATIITSAGSPIRIADNALMMIHDPSGYVWGTAADMRKTAEALDRVRDSIVASYRRTSGLAAEELAEMMASVTWMSAEEAVERGFATEVMGAVEKLAACVPLAAVEALGVPEELQAQVEALIVRPEPEPEPEPAPEPVAAAATETIRLCREGGVLDLAEGLIEKGAPLAAVQAAVKAEGAKRKAETDRQAEIRQLCAAASLAELADGYIEGGMPAAQVRAQLTVVTAKLDQVEVDAGLEPDHGAPRGVRIDTRRIYAELNRDRLPSEKE